MNSSVEKSEIQTYIRLCSLFPFYIRIGILLRQYNGYFFTTYQISVGAGSQRIQRIIVTYFLITCDTIADTQFQVGKNIAMVKFFLRNSPGSSSRRENTPLMVRTETAGTITTYSSSKQVFISIIIVYTTIHRYQRVTFSKTAYALHRLCRSKAIPLECIRQKTVGTSMVTFIIEILVRVTQHGINRVFAELLIILQDGFQQFRIVLQLLYADVAAITITKQVALGYIGVTLNRIISVAQIHLKRERFIEIPICGQITQEFPVLTFVQNLRCKRHRVDTIRRHIIEVTFIIIDRISGIKDIGFVQHATSHFTANRIGHWCLVGICFTIVQVHTQFQFAIQCRMINIHTGIGTGHTGT